MLLAKLYSKSSLALRPALTAPHLTPRHPNPGLLAPRCPAPWAPARNMAFGLESQYSNNKIPDRLRVTYAARHYFETIPLFIVCFFDILIIAGAIVYACRSRIDVQFSHAKNNSISRTMDLRNPQIYKHLVHYQRYEPWPEMQEVLDKMTEAEKRAQSRLENCGKP